MTFLVRDQDIIDALHDRGLRESGHGWPFDHINYAVAAAQRGWALVSCRPARVVVENRDGDRITIRAIDPLPALRSLPNELVRES